MTDSPDLLAEAREIVATVFEATGRETAKLCAKDVRRGFWDIDSEMQIAMKALRRGMELGIAAHSKAMIEDPSG